MLDPSEYEDVLVLVHHNWGDLNIPLPEWIARGPGARPLLRIAAARRASTGEPVALSQVPMQFHNCRRARELQRAGLLPMPWGPPRGTDGPPLDPPPHLRHLVRDCDHD